MIYPFVAESSHRDVGDSGTVEMEVEKKREQNRLAQRKYRKKTYSSTDTTHSTSIH